MVLDGNSMMWGQLWAGAPLPSHYSQPTRNTPFGISADTRSVLSHNSALSAGAVKVAQMKFLKEFDTHKAPEQGHNAGGLSAFK